MKKVVLLLALLLTGLTEEALPVMAAPSKTTSIAGNPNHLQQTRRRLRRQAVQRLRHQRHHGR